MKQFMFNLKTQMLAVSAAAVLLFSCNKDLPEAVPTPYVPPAGSTIMSLLDGPSFSILKAAVNRAGLSTALNTPSNVYTVFAPDDAAFATIGITTPAAVNAFRVGQLDTLLKYHIIGGQRYASSNISTGFPNMYMQSMFVLQQPSAAVPPGFRMPLMVSRRGDSVWANNVAVRLGQGQVNVTASNGIVHVVNRVIMPPDSTIVAIVANDPSYSYLLAAINRADSGVTAPNRLVDALGNPLANFTVMAPTNLAFQQTLTFVITQALIAQGVPPDIALAQAQALASTPAVFSNPALFGALTATTVRGIVAYHVIGRVSANPANSALVGRAFSMNFPSAASNVNTLVVPAPNVGPLPVSVQRSNGVVTVKGLGNPAPAAVTMPDKNAVNGVIHRINGVLLPQ
jgi:uncharacterized surface protein with fasciclin (FAS1) repeats